MKLLRTSLVVLTVAASFAAGPLLAADETTGTAPAVTATVDADGVQRVKMILDSYSYEPAHLIVAAGKPVELMLESISGFAPHNIVIDDPASGLNVRKDVGAGNTTTVTFTPDKTGKFAFYCDKKAPFMASHREKGMEGVLEVR